MRLVVVTLLIPIDLHQTVPQRMGDSMGKGKKSNYVNYVLLQLNLGEYTLHNLQCIY